MNSSADSNIRMKQTTRVGDPLDKNTDIGAINSREQLDKIETYLRYGVEEGACMNAAQREPAPETWLLVSSQLSSLAFNLRSTNRPRGDLRPRFFP